MAVGVKWSKIIDFKPKKKGGKRGLETINPREWGVIDHDDSDSVVKIPKIRISEGDIPTSPLFGDV